MYPTRVRATYQTRPVGLYEGDCREGGGSAVCSVEGGGGGARAAAEGGEGPRAAAEGGGSAACSEMWCDGIGGQGFSARVRQLAD